MKGVVFILCLNCVCFARSNDDVMGRVIALEARMASNDAQHDQEIKELRAIIAEQRETSNQQMNAINELKKTVEGYKKLTSNAALQSVDNTYVNKSIIDGPFQGRGHRSVPEMPVAFTAARLNDQTNVGINQNILFEKVVLNEGNAFHPLTGVFTAPVSGIYCFHASIMARPQTHPFHASITHEGVDIVKMDGENGYDHSTGAVVIRVQAGQDVWVRNLGYVTANIVGSLYGSFTGFLLWEA